MRSKNSGSILIVSMVIVFVAIAMTAAFLFPSIAKHRAMDTEYNAARAKFMALSAVSHSMDELNDFLDGNVGTQAAPILIDAAQPDNGSYFAVAADGGDDTWVISGSGSYRGLTVTVTCTVQRQYESIYDNGLIGGEGNAGAVINGNAGVAGGIFIFGEKPDGSGPLGPTDVAINFSGGGGVRDDYSTMPANLVAKVPGITPEYPLKSEVRVKNGQVNLSGAGSIGTASNPVDAWFGGNIGGTAGSSNLFSNNGKSEPYDVPASFTFPAPNEPYFDGTIMHANYGAYVMATGIDLDAALTAQGTSLKALRLAAGATNEHRIDENTPAFSVFDGADYNSSTHGMRWTPTGVLEVKGLIRTGGTLILGNKGGVTLYFRGKATLWVDSSGTGSGDIEIHNNIISYGTFPVDDVLGLVAQNDVNVATGAGDSQLDFTALIYAGGTFTAAKQVDLAGIVFGNFFDLGANVPGIFAVPQLKDNLPPGWIFDGKVPTVVARVAWQRGN